MADVAKINDVMYTDDDFTAANYAQKFQQLIGDIYDHACSKYSKTSTNSVASGTGSRTINFSDSTSVNQAYAIGQWVYIVSANIDPSTPEFVKNFMVAKVTNASPTSLTVYLALSFGGDHTTCRVVPAGTIVVPSSTVPVGKGGTGATSESSARANLGIGDPSVRMQTLFEDFTGSFTKNSSLAVWEGSGYIFSQLPSPYLTESPSNLRTTGELITAPQQIYKGSSIAVNSAALKSTREQNDWASHPGVIGLSATTAGGMLTMLRIKATYDRGYMTFPHTGDVFEANFMIPESADFTSENPGGFTLGFLGRPNAYIFAVNIGNAGGQPYSSSITPDGSNATPTLFGQFGAVSVLTKFPADANMSVYSDASSQTTAWSPIPGVWYKVRLSKTDCKFYQNGNTLVHTISGWTAPSTPDTTYPVMLWGRLVKSNGSVTNTVLLDYFMLKHPITAR